MATFTANELKKWTTEKKLVVGTLRTMKLLKQGKISKIFVTKNIPLTVKKDLQRNAKVANTEVLELDLTNEQLGLALKKPFLISVISVLK
ncbi:MAG: ribosomal L7Ae/L30e/S12e/Gadd45 family protein [Nanoarchaeota archaeon]